MYPYDVPPTDQRATINDNSIESDVFVVHPKYEQYRIRNNISKTINLFAIDKCDLRAGIIHIIRTYVQHSGISQFAQKPNCLARTSEVFYKQLGC